MDKFGSFVKQVLVSDFHKTKYSLLFLLLVTFDYYCTDKLYYFPEEENGFVGIFYFFQLSQEIEMRIDFDKNHVMLSSINFKMIRIYGRKCKGSSDLEIHNNVLFQILTYQLTDKSDILL